MRKMFLVIAVSFSSASLSAQYIILPRSVEKALNNIAYGATSVVEWYDVPIFYVSLQQHAFRTRDVDDRLQIPAFGFEREIQDAVGQNNRVSLGSMNKERLPEAILLSRLAYAVGTDLLFEETCNHREYKHLAAFHKALFYTNVLTEFVKNWTNRRRPDGSDSRSFFSGHTSTSFAAAAFLTRELGDYLETWGTTSSNASLCTTLKTVSALTLYGWAGYVGWSRMSDNKHYLTDVLAGAAIGTLIGNMVYSSYLADNVLADSRFGFVASERSLSVSFVLSF